MSSSNSFYAGLAPVYHLIYPDWEASVQRQGAALDAIIRDTWGTGVTSVLDASCGIGTQTVGLAQRGYQVSACDLSPEAVDRAKAEADARSLAIDFTVTDMRDLNRHHATPVDLVISCDNSVPHLLTDADILAAFREFWQCARPGGGCLVTVRDYEKEDLSTPQLKSYGLREEDGVRWLLWQLWEPRGAHYDVTFYVVEDRGDTDCRTLAFRTSYYAIGIPKLMELMRQAGFEDLQRIDGRFFQPVMTGRKPVVGATSERGHG